MSRRALFFWTPRPFFEPFAPTRKTWANSESDSMSELLVDEWEASGSESDKLCSAAVTELAPDGCRSTRLRGLRAIRTGIGVETFACSCASTAAVSGLVSPAVPGVVGATALFFGRRPRRFTGGSPDAAAEGVAPMLLLRGRPLRTGRSVEEDTFANSDGAAGSSGVTATDDGAPAAAPIGCSEAARGTCFLRPTFDLPGVAVAAAVGFAEEARLRSCVSSSDSCASATSFWIRFRSSFVGRGRAFPASRKQFC